MYKEIAEENVREYYFVGGLIEGVYLVERNETERVYLAETDALSVAFKIKNVTLRRNDLSGYIVEETHDKSILRKIFRKWTERGKTRTEPNNLNEERRSLSKAG